MSAVHGRNIRVVINGIDVSSHVYAVECRAEANDVCRTQLSLYAVPRWVDGEIHLDLHGPVHHGPLVNAVGQAVRAIVLREEEPL